MPKKSKDDLSRKGAPRQTTKSGLQIPVPKKGEFLRGLKKGAQEKPEESGPSSR